MYSAFSIYLLPPALSLTSGLYLAALSLARQGGGREKVSFALICIWYSMLPVVFILHHMIDDPNRILDIERTVHFFYVFLPVVQVVFFHHVLGLQRRLIVAILLSTSFAFSLTTPTDAYFHGLYRYSWGCIAKGGVAFELFGVYCAVVLAYCIHCFAGRLRVETNPWLGLKYKYMLFSFGLIAVLTFLNIPAIQGKNVYPAGNFIFFPMLLLAYGVLKHRLLEIGSFLHIGLTHLLSVFVIAAPNIFLFVRCRDLVEKMSPGSQFTVLALWFCGNYIYFNATRRLVDRWFYRKRRHLKEIEADVIGEIMVLRNIDDLAERLKDTIRTVLPYSWARLYLYDENGPRLVSEEAGQAHLPEPLIPYLSGHATLIEKQSLAMLPRTDHALNALRRLMTDIEAAALIALVHDDGFIGVLALSEKRDRMPATPDEAAFLKNISASLALALSNAVMYQRISVLKDSLQDQTDALTREIKDRQYAEQNLRAVQDELQASNAALEQAILQANEMTARLEISNHELIREMEDRKRTEAALRQSEETHRLIAENSTDVIWTTDMKGRFTFSSPSVQHLLGYTPQEMLDMGIAAVLTPQSLETAATVIAEEMERVRTRSGGNRRSRATQLEQVRKDGTVVWTEVNTRFMADKERNIIGILGVTRDITERKKSERDLIHMAYFDALTGLHNRKAFIELLEAEIKYAQRYQSGLALMFFDLNKFKLVNDTFGHELGDHLLEAVAHRLKAVIRETDIVARVGGDEFTIILKNPEEILPDVIARRIVHDLSLPFKFEGNRIDFVSASIGIASYPKDGLTAGELMKRADLAMYQAKKGGTGWIHYTKSLPIPHLR